MSSRIGAFLGFLIPPYVIETDKTLILSSTMYVHFYYLYLILGLLCSIAFILGVFGKKIDNKLNLLYKN